MNKSRSRKKKHDPKQTAFTRFMLIVAVLIVWIGAISVRLVYLQVNQHEWLLERALDQRQDIKKSKLLRGTIFDRNNRALAMSINVKTLYADPAEIDNVEKTAKDLARALKLDAARVTRQLKAAKESESRFVPIAKRLEESSVQKVNKELRDPELKKADLPNYAGLHWKDDQKRSYPYGTLAAHVIGFSNSDGVGQAGIERSQEDILHGAVIKKLQERDRLGRVYDETVFEREPPKDVVLTISNSIQYKVEQALAEGVRNANARSGTAIVIDQRNGEILALANYPTFDPDRVGEVSSDVLIDRAIQTVYSPGSVFKLITYGSALEKHLFVPGEQINAGNGSIEVAGHRFSDHHTGVMSYSEALAHSSNVCAIKTGMRVGKADFYSMVQNMGFGRRTGIELPAETAGIVRPPEKWNGDSLASMSIGYEIGVTALQMATAFATIANDGVRVQPHIIKEIQQQDESVLSVVQPKRDQVVSAETARGLRTMLREVVLSGTGRRAQLDGYTSAGKTGTAWKFDPKTKRLEASKYVSSFIGFAPAENPAVTIAVVMDEPQGGARDGGAVSAPVFKAIAEQILPELNVPRTGPDLENSLTAEIIPDLPVSGDVPAAPAEILERPAQPANSKRAPADPVSPRSENPGGKKDRPLPKTEASADTRKVPNNRSSKEKAKQKT